MNYVTKLLSGVVAGLVMVASALPAAAAGNGPLNTPLDAFTDGTPGRYLWTVPGVIKKNGFVTEFMCTNLDAPGTVANIGVAARFGSSWCPSVRVCDAGVDDR